MKRSSFQRVTTRLAATTGLLLATSACVNESYDGVPFDIDYRSDIEAGFSLTLNDDQSVQVDAFGIAIGFTRLIPCDDATATLRRSLPQQFHDWLVPNAHAHSVSTPTSSGIPVVLSTAFSETLRVSNALRPVRGMRFCSLHVQLLNADDDAVGLEHFPQIEHHASSSQIDGEWLNSFAGAPARLALDPPLVADAPQRITLTLSKEKFEEQLRGIGALATPQELSAALQDAALGSFDVSVGPAD